MLNYIEIVTEFINDNFQPSNPENANVKMSTEMLLGFLFKTFPVDCVSDYDLNEILVSLDYKRFTYVVEEHTEVGKKDNKRIEISKRIEIGWCLKSDLNLRTEEIKKL